MVIWKGEAREREKTFEEIMAENFPNLKKSINLHKKIINIGKLLENLELFHSAGGNAKWCSYNGKAV